jgi:quercetin dioxygenase-like cupin family protein
MPFRTSVLEVAEYPCHWHNAPEIIYILQGQVPFTINLKIAVH